MERKLQNVFILIFDDAEVLDFCGAFEVFSSANEVYGSTIFNVKLVSQKRHVRARGGLVVRTDFTFETCPQADILVVSGGTGRKKIMYNQTYLDWVKKQFVKADILLSICTGAFIIGEAGLLKGLKATTYHSAFEEFKKDFPDTTLIEDVKYVDNGKVITSAGISAGINASLHTLDRVLGNGFGQKVADFMEYDIVNN
jgi:transcriptional regulator GlxA family with amidase domain